MKIKNAIFIFVLLMITSCATSKPKGDYVLVEKNSKGKEVKVEYAGQCAYAVSQGDFKTKGKSMFKHETSSGKIYYFADEESKEIFMSKRAHFEKLADRNWDRFDGRI